MFSPGLILLALHFLLGVVAVLYILLSESEEGMKAAWVAFFFLAPVTACVLYIFIGMKYRNPRDFDRLHRNTLEMFRRDLTEEVFRRDSSGMPEQYKPLSTLLESCNKGNIVSKGNSFEIITEGQRMRELFLRDLENATRFIHLEFFRFGADKTGHEIREIL